MPEVKINSARGEQYGPANARQTQRAIRGGTFTSGVSELDQLRYPVTKGDPYMRAQWDQAHQANNYERSVEQAQAAAARRAENEAARAARASQAAAVRAEREMQAAKAAAEKESLTLIKDSVAVWKRRNAVEKKTSDVEETALPLISSALQDRLFVAKLRTNTERQIAQVEKQQLQKLTQEDREQQKGVAWTIADENQKWKYRQNKEKAEERKQQAWERMYANADAENFRRDAVAAQKEANAKAKGGGGGGGGWSRRSMPFVGAANLGDIGTDIGMFAGEALGGPGGAIVGYMVAKAVEDIATLPQRIGSAEMAALGSADPYLKLKFGAYSAGRAGGFSGSDLMGSVFPGGYTSPDWMRATGLGPQEAFDRMTALGITPTSSGQGVGIAKGMAGLQFMPGLSGVDSDPIMRTLAKYGLMGDVNEQSVRAQGAQLSTIMENAIARGMNSADVLRSIDAAVSTTARSNSVGATVGGLADFMFRFTSLPGGMTGETGLKAMQGLDAMRQQVGTDPLRTVMFSQVASKYKTSGSLAGLLGKDAYANLSSNSSYSTILRYYDTAQKRGDQYAASYWLSQLTAGNPGVLTSIVAGTGLVAGPEDMQTLQRARTAGMTPAEYLAGTGGAANGATGSFSVNGSMAGDTGVGAFDSGKTDAYKSALLRQGVNPSIIDSVLKASQKYNIDPVFYGAVLMEESRGGYGKDLSYGKNGQLGAYGLTGEQNPAQISASSGYAKPQSAEDSVMQGAQIIRDKMRPNATAQSVLRSYIGPDYDVAAWNRFSAAYGAGSGIPSELGARSDAQTAGMTGSAASAAEMNLIIPTFNAGLRMAVANLSRLNDVLLKLTGQPAAAHPMPN